MNTDEHRYEKERESSKEGIRSYDSRQRAAKSPESMIVARSFEPIIQRSVGPISKVAFKAALAAQPEVIAAGDISRLRRLPAAFH
jgi:hypothetical protein